MTLRTRNLARAGATALFAAATLAALGVPAAAEPAEADLAVNLTGTTLAATVDGKAAELTVSNRSATGAASGPVVVFETADLDTDKVELPPPDPSCSAAGTLISCPIEEVPAGTNLDLAFFLVPRAGATGPAGSLTVTVRHAGTDPDESNNAVTRDVAVAGSGPDLYAWAMDVPFDWETLSHGTVAPGETAPLYFFVGNQGDRAVGGFRVNAELPAGATFVAPLDGCRLGSARRVLTCSYPDLPMVPEQEDTDFTDDIWSGYGFEVEVKVAADAEAGVHLTDGVVTVAGTAVVDQSAAARARAELPAGVQGLAPDQLDVDPTDNVDEFSILVGSPDEGGAGGGLPVTGVQAGVIGGLGAAFAAVGVLLFLVSRRRRVVLVALADERGGSGPAGVSLR